jgi:HD-like signal output (HDOD) protein
VLQLANQDNVQLHQLVDLVGSDPAFAGEVLTVANSLLYAPRFPANSILQAIAFIGVNNLQGLCLTVGVRAYLGRTFSLPAMRVVWRHNLACAILAEQIAAGGTLDKDQAYTAGVMHDVGRLGLAVLRPREYTGLLGSFVGSASAILEAERETLGTDHCEAGRRIVTDWKLPAEFDAVVACHHEPQIGQEWGLPLLIQLSCRLADSLGFSAFPGCQAESFEQLLDLLPARERRAFPATAETLAPEIERKLRSLENS